MNFSIKPTPIDAGIRTPHWRFNQWSDGHRELYDLEADPEELHEVSADQAEVVKALTQKLKALPAFTP
jgi:hypothetical protein